jgi:PEGA domain
MERALTNVLFELSPADPRILLKKFMNDLFSEDIEAENRAFSEDATRSIKYDQKAGPIPNGRAESRSQIQQEKKTQHSGIRFSHVFLAAAVMTVAIAGLLLLLNNTGENIWTSLFPLSSVKGTDNSGYQGEAVQKSVERPVPPAAEQVAQPDKQEPKESPKGDQALKKVSPEAVSGNLTINAIPWAEIYINEKHYGTTPKTVKALKAGTYSVRLENPQYDVWTTKVAVREAKTVTIAHKFEGSGKITVNAVPWGNVYLDGVLKGQTPITIGKIPARVYEIKISREGYADVRKNIQLKTGASEFVSVKLQKEGQ